MAEERLISVSPAELEQKGLLIGGIAGFAVQPGSSVYLSMALTGLIVTIVAGALRLTLPKRYAEFEIRRMQALDA